MTTEYTFTTRLAALIGCDILLTVLNAYIPHDLAPVKTLVAVVQLCFMAATMWTVVKRVLEDY